jgi:RHS repeat-associated protein
VSLGEAAAGIAAKFVRGRGLHRVSCDVCDRDVRSRAENGNVVQDELHYPWGQEWTMVGTMEEERFARLNHRDSETSLDPTHFRMYASGQGRWLSPDPLMGHPFNPQTFNRYGYAGGNPSNWVDPRGLDYCATPIWDDQGNLIGYDPNSCVPDNQYYGQFGYTYVEPQIVNTGAPPTSNSGFWTSLMGVWNTLTSIPWSGSAFIPLIPIGEGIGGAVGVNIVGGYIPQFNTVCAGIGPGAAYPLSKGYSFGPIPQGNLSNATSVLSGWSLSFTGQSSAAVGYQRIWNTSGSMSGPTYGTTGWSASFTVSGCASF